MSADLYKKAGDNWNTTMAAYHRRGNSASTSSCASDIRNSLPSCLQYAPEWCWATAVAEVAAFYKPNDYPASGNDCHNMECKIVGYKIDPSNEGICCNSKHFCPIRYKCCKSVFSRHTVCRDRCAKLFLKAVDDGECYKDHCASISAFPWDIVNAIQRLTGRAYAKKTDGPLSVEELDKILGKGHPVIIGVSCEFGGHALTLGGCVAGGGPYYLHDPADKQGSYQILTYEGVTEYAPPYFPKSKCHWFWTFWLEGDLSESSDEIVIYM